jgi:magnesium-transporting ATPase (P-type)
MLCICTAHECILNQLNEYHGSSPDEITLVSSAREAGYAFKENSFNQITISMKVEDSTFLLRLCELF